MKHRQTVAKEEGLVYTTALKDFFEFLVSCPSFPVFYK